MTPSPTSCRRPRVLAVVTLFCPPPGVVDNLMTYVPHTDGLYIWDNTPGGARITWPTAIADRIVTHRLGANVGIARALNAARRMTLAEGYDLLLTMDQDSRFRRDLPSNAPRHHGWTCRPPARRLDHPATRLDSELAERPKADCGILSTHESALATS